MPCTINTDLIGYNIPKQKYDFTPGQEKLIEKHIEFIFTWLKMLGLDEREYYDVAVFGFLSGIQKYDESRSDANLRALLSREMKHSVSDHRQFMLRLERCVLNDYVSLWDAYDFEEKNTFESRNDLTTKYSLDKLAIHRSILEDIFSRKSCKDENEFIKLLALEYTIPEIAKKLKISQHTAYKRAHEIRAKLKRKFTNKYGKFL